MNVRLNDSKLLCFILRQHQNHQNCRSLATATIDTKPPTKPRRASQFYVSEQYMRIRAQNSDRSREECQSIGYREWSTLSRQDQLPYIEKQKADRQRYEMECQTVENGHPHKRRIIPFAVFTQEEYGKLFNAYPDEDHFSITRRLSAKWKTLSTEERSRYSNHQANLSIAGNSDASPATNPFIIPYKNETNKLWRELYNLLPKNYYSSVSKTQQHRSSNPTTAPLSNHQKNRILKILKVPKSPTSPYYFFNRQFLRAYCSSNEFKPIKRQRQPPFQALDGSQKCPPSVEVTTSAANSTPGQMSSRAWSLLTDTQREYFQSKHDAEVARYRHTLKSWSDGMEQKGMRKFISILIPKIHLKYLKESNLKC